MGVSAIELARLQARDEQLRVLLDLSAYISERGGEALVSDARRQIGLNDLQDARRLCHWAARVLLLDRHRTRAGEVYRLRGRPPAAQRVRPNG